ncbi:MAG: bifunctional oligoribonuclease/PAP phosphatase NrnA [Eubacteriales bacterium]|nr:bifunctional oligoribonuclease/PAP phosphatase NrnA [Eubacteriales bacterium]
MKRTILKEIANKLKESKTALLYPHVVLDGDTLGSSIALCVALRKLGKTAHILIEDEIPSYLRFLDLNNDYCTYDQHIIDEPDLSIAIDCSDIKRLPLRREKFLSGKSSINLDHHKTNQLFADINYIDEDASATSEIIFNLVKLMDVKLDSEIAEGIYTAIITDTGNFQYTNTTKTTHLIAAELFDIGIDMEKISIEIYQKVRIEQIKISGEIFGNMEMLFNGKANIAFVNQEMLKKTGALMEETEGVISTLRNIIGVEISAFLKEKHNNEIKVGLRSKTYGDVSVIAQKFGGGGHQKAAGCTLNTTIEEAKKLITAEIIAHLEEAEKRVKKTEKQHKI